MKSIKKLSLRMSAAIVTGASMSSSAFAGTSTDFSSIASNITSSISSLPGLISALCYLFGILLGALGILKIKDHVENPSNTPLKDGAIRLAAGGGLLALPIIYNAMFNTIGSGTQSTQAVLDHVSFQ